MQVTKHIPNFLTLCNLACGCFGVVAVFKGDLQLGAMMIWAGALFDFFDGFAARMLKRYSLIGKDLDSLADLVTFCFLPGAMLYWSIYQNARWPWLAYSGFLLVVFGALRLSKFNNDTRQTENFHGLPVPASGIFVSALPFLLSAGFAGLSSDAMVVVLVGSAIFLSAMMVSDIRLMSLKFKNFSFNANRPRYLLLFVSLALLALFKFIALPLIIIWYLLLSLASNFKK
ncbi:MAG: CDP-diacylglycerol--serine O-phosphatidyltransferase [Cyclobacteriaceae bacterium]|nr:CDP-diacylglycerol--serine O-phosphatidyltransferase [Cyclobacteriaceae bacterium]